MNREYTAPRKVRSALFIDFDNIYIRLEQQDTQLAYEFASHPGKWLTWLETQLPANQQDFQAQARNILVRRCYLNPKSFQQFRPFFIHSAFEVIDCPPLTGQGKTSADIRMVMDILDLLDHPTHFDEFIIFSGDADFTHVLLKLRRHDRRSTVLAIGPASTAYSAACDYLIEQDSFIDALLGIEPQLEHPEAVKTVAREPAKTIVRDPETLTAIARFIREFIGQAAKPVVMARLAGEISRRFQNEIVDTNWMGYGTFKDFLAELRLDGLVISPEIPGYVYDPERHEPPDPSRPGDEFHERYPELAPLARKINRLTDTPYLLPEYYAVLLHEIADEVNENGFMLTRTSKAVRDRCLDEDAPIARSHVNFVLRGITFAGHHFERGAETARELAGALVENTLNLCDLAQLELSENERAEVRQWILGSQDG